MRVVFIGCGYVSSFYAETLGNHPQIELCGAMDAVDRHATDFCQRYKTRKYETLTQVLEDSSVDAIVNLTNPKSHYEISRAALNAGKHVYTEKPLATQLADAKDLVDLAKSKQLLISSAPCNVLGESAQTLWRALRENLIGVPRLVYAEMDDGMVHRFPYKNWISETGRPWPYKDEFEVGCTLEHAGYYITWLVAFFGSVTELTTFADCVIKDKRTDESLDHQSPDLTVACLRFESGTVARLTCSIVAPHDHQIRIFGEQGTLSTHDCWFYDSPVHYQPLSTLSQRRQKIPFLARMKGLAKRKIKPVRPHKLAHRYRVGGHRMDFARGISELADAVQEGREARLSADFCLHVNEVVLRIQDPVPGRSTSTMETSAGAMRPMRWAKDRISNHRVQEPAALVRHQMHQASM